MTIISKNAMQHLTTGRYISIELLPDGNLLITATTDGLEWIREHIEIYNSIEIWDGLLEDFVGNGIYERIDSADVGFMIDRPAIGYGIEWDCYSEITKVEQAWYFELFDFVNEIERLGEGVSVEFKKTS